MKDILLAVAFAMSSVAFGLALWGNGPDLFTVVFAVSALGISCAAWKAQ
jgi:hypothetical protein